MLSLTAWAVLGGGFAGGFVSGVAGFGTGVVALGLWLRVMPPATAAALVALCSVASQAQTIPAIRHALDPARLWPMLLAGLIGVPIGTRLLVHIDPELFHLGLGALLLGFSGFMLLAQMRTRFLWGGRGADAAVGFAGGVLGGLAGLSGPLPTMWATLRGWGKDERRGVFQAFNLTILAAAAASDAAAGLFTPQLGRLLLVALPGTVCGSWLGLRCYRRLSDGHFRVVVLVLLGASGLSLVWGAA